MFKYGGIVMGITTTIICIMFTISCLIQNLWGMTAVSIIFVIGAICITKTEYDEYKDKEL